MATRIDGLTPQQHRFIVEIRYGASVDEAIRTTGINRSTWREWCRTNDKFRAAALAALEMEVTTNGD